MYSVADEADFVICGGDFNARIGNKNDYVERIDHVQPRIILDREINKHAEPFIEFLPSAKMCIINGRVTGKDDFTYISPKGKSVVEYCLTPMDHLKRLRLIFKEKQNKFDTIFRKSKRIHARRHEVQIENMVGSNGPAMWREIEKIGPSKPKVKIPEEVVINNKSKYQYDIKTVLDKWAKDFATLYKRFPENSPNYDKNFLTQAKAISTKAPFGDKSNNQILNNIFTEHKVKKTHNGCKVRKSSIGDEIPN